jgi:preprotein translocase subunit SecE
MFDLSPTKPDFGSKGPVVFLQEVRAELAKVIWPKRAEVIRLTIIVIAVSVAVALYVGGLDFIFTSVTNFLVKQ